MIKKQSMEDAVESILNEGVVQSTMKVGKPISDDYPDPTKTQNKVSKPKNIKGTCFYTSIDNEEDEEEKNFEYKTGDEVIDAVVNYFNRSTAASIGGIPLSKAVKYINKLYNFSKPKIMSAIKQLIQDDILINGISEGTLMINSLDNTIDLSDDEDEEGITDADGKPLPIMDNETPETLKAKGWTEITPGTFIGPDGVQKYVIASEDCKTMINNIMFNKNSFEALCEEFEEDFDSIEGMDDTDETEGLDEFDTDDDMDSDDEEEITVSLTRDEVDLLKSILGKLGAEDDIEIDDEVEDEDTVDDLATDEEANADLMGGDEVDEDKDEDEEFDMGGDVDVDEDEESIADETNSVYDGSGRNGAATLTKNTPAYGSLRRSPITGAYAPNAGGTAYDGSGRNGAATLTKNTPAYDRKRGPLASKVTSAARSKKSIFDL